MNPMIQNILFPVDFSPACTAMAGYVKRAAAIFGARVTLIHVCDLASRNGFEIYVRSVSDIAEEHRTLALEKLNSFLQSEFPVAECPRILLSGDPATQITHAARAGAFDLIVMPTHAGRFRQMLLGSTTAKLLNDADCPVLTTQHAETMVPRPLEHREWLCAIALTGDSQRVIRLATQAAEAARARLSLIHAIQMADPDMSTELGPAQETNSVEIHEARQRAEKFRASVGSNAELRVIIGRAIKDALVEAARRTETDVLMIGRGPQSGGLGRMRDLIYQVVRDSPIPVLSV